MSHLMDAEGPHALMTACACLASTVDAIDAQLGEGYAKAHPELIVAFMHTAVADTAAMMIVKELRNLTAIVQALKA